MLRGVGVGDGIVGVKVGGGAVRVKVGETTVRVGGGVSVSVGAKVGVTDSASSVGCAGEFIIDEHPASANPKEAVPARFIKFLREIFLPDDLLEIISPHT